MTLTEKVAYLKGLVEGIAVDETTTAPPSCMRK